ncbi:MAG: CTP synthase [Candidatus Pacearchaeota archaeon]|nr:CTP synthase [Candidatus Pacearchaeota archaeon]
MTKYIFVVGGVLSGVGKGTSVAAIAKILKEYGFNVTAIKIDPYINYDAGTLRPTEHGEVWVTENGGETDQDLGIYERFLGENIPKSNNITTGQIYKSLIEKERAGFFLGKTVQFIPHVIEEIKSRIVEVSNSFEIAVIEIGGTVGDYENIPFLLAAKALERELGGKNVIYVLVSYLPVPLNIKEPKTKPTQHSIRMLLEHGIFPDFVLCRSHEALDEVRKKKIEQFLNIPKEKIISAPDVLNIYSIPLNFEKEGLGKKILEELQLEPKQQPNWSLWKNLVENMENAKEEVNVAIVGKYLDIGGYQLQDSYVSVRESILHASAHLKVKPNIFWIDSKNLEKRESVSQLSHYHGIIIPGGFGIAGTKGKINAIEYARKNKIPFLGLCFGLQLAVVEFARNVCGLEADSTEIDPNTKHPVIDLLPYQKELLEKNQYGATMRLGSYPAKIKENTIVFELYDFFGKLKKEGNFFYVTERHRHRYEVNPLYHNILKENGLVFSGIHVRADGTELIEFIELPREEHPFFVATQAHPEFKSTFENPAPLFYGFLKACIDYKNSKPRI